MPESKKQEPVSFATIRGSVLTLGTQWSGRIIGLGSTIILARVLTPADFGIVAVGMAVPVMLDALTSISSWAYLQRVDTLDREKLDTAFTISSARGVLVAMVIFVAALLAPLLHADARLPAVLCGFALSPLIESLSNPRIVEYARALEFGFIARRQLYTKVAGSITSIIIALFFRSYWALVIGVLMRSITWTTLTYFVKPYKPRFSLADWRNALGFSIWLSLRTLIDRVGKQADRLIIAQWAGLSQVGSFAVAQDFAWITAAELFDAAKNVLLPAFGKFRDKPRELQANVIEAYAFLVAFALPCTVGAALVGPQLVILIYGAKWASAAEMVRPLALALAFQSTETITSALVLAMGTPKSLMMRSGVATALRLCLLTIGLALFDIHTAVWMLVPVSIATGAINLSLLRTITCLPVSAFVLSVWRSWLAVIIMSAAVLSVNITAAREISFSLLLIVGGEVAIGVAAYVFVHLLLWVLVGRPPGPELRMLKLFSGKWLRSV